MGIYYNKQRARWIAQVAFQGHRASRCCPSHTIARLAEAELLQQLHQVYAKYSGREDVHDSVQAVCTAYLRRLELRGKTKESIARATDTVKRLEEFFGPRMHTSILLFTANDLYAFRTARIEHGRKASTINRDLHTIRAIWKQGAVNFRFPGDLFTREDNIRVRWLTPAQQTDVFRRLRSPFSQMAQLAAMALLRITEVCTLRREQVSLTQGVLALPKTKTGPNAVVLNMRAIEILRQQLASHHSEWVFPGRRDSPYSRGHVGKMWRQAATAAGLGDFTFHDLRHHGTTTALNAGFSSAIVMRLGRWRSERVMLRYAAVTDKTLRAAAEAVAGAAGDSPID